MKTAVKGYAEAQERLLVRSKTDSSSPIYTCIAYISLLYRRSHQCHLMVKHLLIPQYFHSRTGQWDIGRQCVVHIGIVLFSPIVYNSTGQCTMVQQYRAGQWDLGIQCVVHIGIVLYSPIVYYGTTVQDRTVGFR